MLEIITLGNDILTKRAEEISDLSEDIIELAENMSRTLYLAPGLGLAAPQVNRSIRLITVDLSLGENRQDIIALINPQILRKEGEAALVEGCLSIPGINEKVIRPYQVEVRAVDLNGKERIFEARNLLARVFCHEIDHLDGKLFIDYLSPLKRSLIRKKFQKQKNQPESK